MNINALSYWIKKNVKHPINNCFFYSSVIAVLFPDLKLIRGIHTGQQHRGNIIHFWNEIDGKIIDATSKQLRTGKYIGGEVVDVTKNLDFIINDPLFKTLSIVDRYKILRLALNITQR